MNSNRFCCCWRFLGPCLVFVLGLAGLGAAPDMATKEFVRSEYPKALASLEAKFARCSGEGIFTKVVRGKAGEPISRVKVEFAFSGDNGRLIKTVLDGPGESGGVSPPQKKQEAPRSHQAVVGYNSRYSFMLSKWNPTSDYFIRHLKDGPESGRRDVVTGPGHAIRCVSTTHFAPIASLFASSKFQLDRVTEIQPAVQPRRLRIEFSMHGKPPDRPGVYRNKSGWLVVSPEDQWILHESGAVMVSPKLGRMHTDVKHVSYGRGPSGEPVPVKYDLKTYRGEFAADPAASDPGAIPSSTEEFQFTKLRFGATPDREFTLSAFGLPEFGQVASRPSPWHAIWICGAAAVAIGVAFTLRRLSTRSRVARGHQVG